MTLFIAGIVIVTSLALYGLGRLILDKIEKDVEKEVMEDFYVNKLIELSKRMGKLEEKNEI